MVMYVRLLIFLHNPSCFIVDDIAVRQFISINGRYQLNDFNTAKFIHWSEKEQAVCPCIDTYFFDKNRSPEEMRNEVNFIDEKIDVYSLGNIFYKLIANDVSFLVYVDILIYLMHLK